MMRKVVVVLVLAVFLTTSIFIPSNVAAEEQQDFFLEGVKAAFLYDASSGVVLYEYNADVPRAPASMTKLMTYFVVRDAIEAGKISWTDKVKASKYAEDTIGSQIGVQEGDELTVYELVRALLIISANDAAVMLAEHVAGSEIAFAQLMKAKARELGLSAHANFVTASGLGRNSLGPYNPKNVVGETMMTARDMGMLAYHLIKTYPEVLNITSTPVWGLVEDDLSMNTNLMLETSPYLNEFGVNPYIYPGLDGLKTGYIAAAGYTFTGTAERYGLRLISVVMGTQSTTARFEKTAELLDYGFSLYFPHPLLIGGSQLDLVRTVSVVNGSKSEAKVVLAHDVIFMEHPGYEPADYEVEVDRQVTLPFNAPLKKGDKVGVATIKYRGSVQQVDLIVAEDVYVAEEKSRTYAFQAPRLLTQWFQQIQQWLVHLGNKTIALR